MSNHCDQFEFCACVNPFSMGCGVRSTTSANFPPTHRLSAAPVYSGQYLMGCLVLALVHSSGWMAGVYQFLGFCKILRIQELWAFLRKFCEIFQRFSCLMFFDVSGLYLPNFDQFWSNIMASAWLWVQGRVNFWQRRKLFNFKIEKTSLVCRLKFCTYQGLWFMWVYMRLVRAAKYLLFPTSCKENFGFRTTNLNCFSCWNLLMRGFKMT